MPTPTASQLAAFIGPNYSCPEDKATAVIGIVTAMARSYTRGNGFDEDGEPFEDVAAAITTASARLLSHSRQVGASEQYGENRASFEAAPFAWSTGELAALNRYRTRAV